ncbi:hypothetical protein IQ229_07065 [Nostoc cf. edaphicum LEGE 07299]|uniref:Uncharacterized protein n=1 Tax=Nostoc cf. edaphicum LEGE 07299 TaxID=2777974 RepID=A0ABR9TWC1_9NOSO|nr:hypothetical protein [Nostoc edaphicum]MBE9104710.1 hypothetical protein [Nostoc cf. edaphicum LEGE 07299]
MDDNSQRGDFLQALSKAGVLVFLVAIALVVRSCSFFEAKPTISNTSEIAENTEEFIGNSVTIKSRVIRKIGSSSFTVNDARFFRGEPLVVVNASGVPFNLPSDENIKVQVTGQVRNLVIPKIEQEFNLNIQDEYYKDYINQPAIVARYIVLAPQSGQITQRPEQYYRRQVAVTGEVENIRSPVLLTLDENQLFGGQDLLVLLKAPPKVAINQGQTVSIIGKVRPFVIAEIEQDYDFTWDLNVKRELEVEYGNRPVLVADTIYPS